MPKTILIVDDEPAWLKLLERLFKENGYDVLKACSRADASEIIKTRGFDCVVVDFNLGDGDGAEVCAVVRGSAKRTAPIVMFSSDPAAEKSLEGKCPPDRILFKGCRFAELLAVVRELLRARA